MGCRGDIVAHLHFSIEKRKNRSRRRAFHADADVDYINKRNMLFNKKVCEHTRLAVFLHLRRPSAFMASTRKKSRIVWSEVQLCSVTSSMFKYNDSGLMLYS